MAATDIVKRIYAPTALVGQIYAAPYGTTNLPPIGNVLEASVEYKESVESQDDMTQLGGGKHGERRRVTDITFKAKLADLNVVNLARGVLGTIEPQNAGSVADKPYTVARGTLIPLPHAGVTNLLLKKGTNVVAAAGNFDLLPEGIRIRADAIVLTDGDAITVSYDYADQVVIEALTAKAPELVIRFGGLNEADSGRPVLIDLWRVSQSVTKKLALLQAKGFAALEIEGSLLQDPTKVAVGISRYMRTTHV
ncbi:MAG: hypothetical protein K2Y10_00325 [Burkholderiaceae bacterium]|nr:hypothetical protein [Burkholderiaceae bacterium]MBY0454752.1 hypothetical protein [Burkholderiaceae bacterium]